MIPLVNGKSLMLCTEEDLQIIIGNEDYRENEYLDYKFSFSFLEPETNKDNREMKKREFRNDVCSFANTEGGYLLFGIGENNGCASSIEGVYIPEDNIDKFELNIRNAFNRIEPKSPSVSFHFIKLKNGKYVVILYVKHDGFAPYIHIEDEKNYKIYKRYGNEKRIMTYNELKLMFNQSLSLEQAIRNYTEKRISDYKSLKDSFGKSFAYVSIIPETFMDSSYKQNVYALTQTGKVKLSGMFSSIGCDDSMIPCVDGIRFVPYSEQRGHCEAYVKNNGITEFCIFLDEHIYRGKPDKYPDGFLPWEWLYERIKFVYYNYITTQIFKEFGERKYFCLSIIGCKNVKTDDTELWNDNTGKIDRDEIVCDPIIITTSETDNEKVVKQVYLQLLLSIGVKNDNILKNLLKELYD